MDMSIDGSQPSEKDIKQSFWNRFTFGFQTSSAKKSSFIDDS